MRGEHILRVLVLLILSFAMSSAEDLPDSVFPWGVYCGTVISSGAEHDYMRDSLGINWINLAWDSWQNSFIEGLMADGFYVYPNRLPNIGDGVNYVKYAYTRYSVISAWDDSSQYRFYIRNSIGNDELYGFFPYEDTIAESGYEIVLDSLWMKQEPKYRGGFGDPPVEFRRAICMRIDTAGVADDDIVAMLVTDECNYTGGDRTNIDTVYIMGSSFNSPAPETLECGFYTKTTAERRTYFRILSACETEVYFDFLKIYCPNAKILIDDHDIDNQLKSAVSTLFNDEPVAGWFLSDEPIYGQFRPMRYIDSLIQFTADSLGMDTARVFVAWATEVGNVIYDFIDIVQPDEIWTYIYPFHGGQICTGAIPVTSPLTHYAGSFEYGEGGITHRGLQLALSRYFDTWADTVRQACRANSIDWWLGAQAFGYQWKTTDSTTCNDGWQWRLPTKAELTCCIYMGLCFDARGIGFWRYHGNNFPYLFAPGLKYPQGDSVTPGYYAVKENMPYIRAMWPTFDKLVWDTTYTYHPDSLPDPPAISAIASITAAANSADTNPDLGWFQIGEFHDDSGESYFLLVNRACSQGENDATEAGSITAIVEINRGEFDDAERLFVIDIAHEVDSNWHAIPETTYTTLYGDKLYFTTILKAGEGRLFKIAGYNDKTNNILTVNNNELY
jgi:hypothetical protein